MPVEEIQQKAMKAIAEFVGNVRDAESKESGGDIEPEPEETPF